MTPRDTSFESQGAEFLVLGLLLTEGIAAYKAYVRTPSFDIVANGLTDAPRTIGKHTARISVKSRYWTNASGSVVPKDEFEFLVYVRLNRGWKSKIRRADDGRKNPDIYVYPKPDWESLKGVSKAAKRRLPRKPPEKFKNRWDLIRKYVETGKFEKVE